MRISGHISNQIEITIPIEEAERLLDWVPLNFVGVVIGCLELGRRKPI
jgi:hypothetical protein